MSPLYDQPQGSLLVCLQVTPSGGLIGFKIADDLLTKEYKEEKEGLAQIGGNHNKSDCRLPSQQD